MTSPNDIIAACRTFEERHPAHHTGVPRETPEPLGAPAIWAAELGAPLAEGLGKPDPVRLEALGRELMAALGLPITPSTADTPRRWAAWWCEFLNYTDGKTETTFTAEHVDQLVVVSGVRVWSLCEHHLLPFYCDIAMGYTVREKILGLSKFARIAHLHARRLNVQERLVSDIAKHIERVTGSPDVAVVGRGEHLCMTMRGIRAPALMTSSAMFGVFRENAAARAEFLSLALRQQPE